MSRSQTYDAAIEYATKYGWSVFPIQEPKTGDPQSGKRPLTPRGKDDATTDTRIIDVWWNAWPDANVGIACEPSGLVVLDVDVGPILNDDGICIGHKMGRESLAEYNNIIPATLTAVTGGGGLHLVYKATEGAPPQKIGFRDGLDLIGKGYIVAAPSLHWSGNRYRWSDIRAIQPLPAILRNAHKKDAPKDESKPPLEPLDRPGIAAGGRNNALFKLGAVLRDQGIGAQALAAAMHWENQQRCVPPLGDEELKQIIDSILRRVAPSRDVAAGAVLAEEIRAIVQPEPRAMWISEVSAHEQPPMHWYPTGFDELDVMLGGGIPTRQVCGIIGPPSAGKSAFVGSLVEQLLKTIPVLHCSTELPREELFVRYAALKMGFPWRDGMKGIVARADMRASVAEMRIKLIGSDNIDRTNPIAMLKDEATAMRDQYGTAPAIVLDYVQMLARGQTEVRQRVGELTMGLRILSQELDCPVIAVFSTRRAFYGGATTDAIREADDPTAYLAAAKESGDIEFDCATLLYLDVDKNHDGQPKPARIVVARCRVGDIGFAGARAALDVGRWWGDSAALVELAAETKKENKQLAAEERDQMKLIDFVRRMPGRSWADICKAMSIPTKRVNAARSVLLQSGDLETVRESTYDANGRPVKRDILKIGVPKPPTPTETTP